MTPVRRLFDFWFLPASHPMYGRVRAVWFEQSDEFDTRLRNGFADDYEAAARGELDGLAERPEGALALTILLDQVPRNLFRGSAKAFATDCRARRVADAALARGFERHLLPVQRQFFCLPFMHSENMADQRRSLKLYADLRLYAETRDVIDNAIEHFEVIARFGRFPHRNAVLGRESTDAEEAYLAAGGGTFGAVASASTSERMKGP